MSPADQSYAWASVTFDLLLQSVRRGRVAMRQYQVVIEELLRAVRARGPPVKSDTTIAAHLLRIVDPATGSGLPDELLLPEVAILYLAGVETSAHTVAFVLCVPIGCVLGFHRVLLPGSPCTWPAWRRLCCAPLRRCGAFLVMPQGLPGFCWVAAPVASLRRDVRAHCRLCAPVTLFAVTFLAWY